MMASAQVAHALDALEARGARAFDAPTCDCVRALIARAEALDLTARTLLHERARVHVQRLALRFDRARADAERRLDAAERAHGDLPIERAALARGELGALRYGLRRLEARSAWPAPRERQRSAHDYEASLAELSASFTVARAVDTVPEHAGPYNPVRIATDLLAWIGRLSPIYLTTQLNRLEELASMLELPDPASPPEQPRKARRASKARA
jgi:Protein of unknown function (DUF2894)